MQLTPFRLEQYFAQYEFSAPYQLCNSDCEAMTIGELLAFEEDAEERFQAHWLGYTETQGDPDLRGTVATLYDSLRPDQILLLAGAEEGIFLFINVALDAGDHIIVQFPGYQSLYQIAEDIGCEVTRWTICEREQTWEVDFDSLRAAIRPTTKAIIVNSPHNPTGHLLNKQALETLAAIARAHNLYLFCDEVYKSLELGDNPAVPAGCDVYDNAVSLGVMSKSFGLPGLRIGWIASHNTELLVKMQEFKYYTTICNSAPSEFLANLALRHKERLLQRNKAIIKQNLSVAGPFFADYAALFNWIPPQAGPVAFPALRFEEPLEMFYRDLIETQGVLLAPGSMFGLNDDHFRMGFGRKNFPENLTHFRAYLEQRF